MNSDEPEYAGFWIRLWASLIDTVLLGILLIPMLMAIYENYWSSTRLIQGPADFLLSWLLPAVLVVLFWVKRQATPGKMATTLYIVDASSGLKPTAKQWAIRYAGYYLSALPLCLGFIWVAFDARKQGWHDKLAGTVVLHGKAGPAR
jgi:uncharacterized RDD family membrane protein YckC